MSAVIATKLMYLGAGVELARRKRTAIAPRK